MKKGTIGKVYDNTSSKGKKYKNIYIDGEKYSVWEKKLFEYCVEGKNIQFSDTENDGFKNITAFAEVLGEMNPLSPDQKVVKDCKSAEDTKTDNYKFCNANNNGTLMMDIFQREGLLEGKTAQEIMQIKQSLLKLEMSFLTDGKIVGVEEAKNLFLKGGQ